MDTTSQEETPTGEPAQSEASAAPEAPEKAAPQTPVTYPYLDEAGYYHYQIYLNGELLPLEHDALLRVDNNAHNEIVYPLSEMLDYFGVAYLWDEATDDFSTSINGIKVSRDSNDEDFMWFSNHTDGYGNGMIPGSINGAFYTPNYVFEHTIGATLTKISKGDEMSCDHIDITTSKSYSWGVGATTVAVRRWDGDQYVLDGEDGAGSDGGISTLDGNESSGGEQSKGQTCPTCGGNGRSICSACGGSGMAWNNQMVYDPISGTMKSQTVQTTCWSCGGARGKTCTTCGGDGRIN